MTQIQAVKSEVHDALLATAFLNGRRAGLAGLPLSLAEGQPGSPENFEWLRGWQSAVNQRASDRAHQLLIASPCRYTKGTSCDCGGRGLCLDAA